MVWKDRPERLPRLAVFRTREWRSGRPLRPRAIRLRLFECDPHSRRRSRRDHRRSVDPLRRSARRLRDEQTRPRRDGHD